MKLTGPRVACLLAVLFFSFAICWRWNARTGWTALLGFSGNAPALDALPALHGLPVARLRDNGGYDGQFYAQLALAPDLREPALSRTLDDPAYRARRIFGAWIAWLCGWGDPWATLRAFALINVACWFLMAALLPRWLPMAGWRGTAAWLALLFGVGVVDSVRYSLTDLPSLTLIGLAAVACKFRRPWASAFALAAAALTRETGLLAVGLLLPPRGPVARRPWVAAAVSAILVALPLVGWMLWVGHVFGFSGTAGTGNFSWPFLGWCRQVAGCAGHLLGGDWSARNFFGLLGALSLAWQAVWLCWRRMPDDPWWRIGIAHVLLLVVLGDSVWGGYWAALRALLPLTAAYTVCIVGEKRFWPLLIAANLTLPHALWRLLSF